MLIRKIRTDVSLNINVTILFCFLLSISKHFVVNYLIKDKLAWVTLSMQIGERMIQCRCVSHSQICLEKLTHRLCCFFFLYAFSHPKYFVLSFHHPQVQLIKEKTKHQRNIFILNYLPTHLINEYFFFVWIVYVLTKY